MLENAREIAVERCVTQLIEDSFYKGYLNIGGMQIDYEATFLIPVSKLHTSGWKSLKCIAEVRKIFQLTLSSKDSNFIEMSDDEAGFFIGMLFSFIIENFSESVFTVSIIHNSKIYVKDDKLINILSDKKYGCKF